MNNFIKILILAKALIVIFIFKSTDIKIEHTFFVRKIAN
jgi:hypothetical protein